jgi:hypothetical protein
VGPALERAVDEITAIARRLFVAAGGDRRRSDLTGR